MAIIVIVFIVIAGGGGGALSIPVICFCFRLVKEVKCVALESYLT